MRKKLFILAPLIAVGLWWHTAPRFADLPPDLLRPITEDVEFLDRNGQSLRRTPRTPGEFRGRLHTLPTNLALAVIAAEDKRFYSHNGVDPAAVARALIKRHGGASTITQQLIKSSRPHAPRSVRNKLQIMLLARRLEQEWSKDRILLEYLSRVEFGNRQIGSERAAQFYFGKSPQELSMAESAYLAGLVRAPARLNPHRNPEAAMQRQRLVLSRMKRVLPGDVIQRALEEPLKLLAPAREWHAPHFVDMLMRSPDTFSGPVQTTLDLPLQHFSQRILESRVATLAAENVNDGAVVIIENSTGHILALCGSPDYHRPVSGQVNGALASRSSGSALKPFIYAMAFEQGDSDESLVDDSPAIFETGGGMYRPVNYNRKHYGFVTYRNALGNSLNISAVKILQRIGGPSALRARLRASGLTTFTEAPEHYGPGLAIGNGGVRLLELTNAYAALARGGLYQPTRSLPSREAEQPIRRFSAAASAMVTDVLCDNNARADTFGWNSPLKLPFPVAVKTGTSTDYRDNWCIGYTPEFTVGVWVGNFDGSPMRNVSGVTGAGPIFHDLFLHLAKEYGVTAFPDLERRPGSGFAQKDVNIEWPKPGARLLLDPDLPGGSHLLTPRLSMDASAEWFSATLKVLEDGRIELKPGLHELSARTADGSIGSVQFEVLEL